MEWVRLKDTQITPDSNWQKVRTESHLTENLTNYSVRCSERLGELVTHWYDGVGSIPTSGIQQYMEWVRLKDTQITHFIIYSYEKH